MSFVLIYDSSKNSGHHLEYVQFILQGIKEDGSKQKKYYFVLNSSMKLALNEDSIIPDNCKIVYIEECIQEKWNRLNPFLKSNAEIHYIYNFSLEKEIKRIVFLAIDRYQYALGINKSLFSNIRVEGILFKPYTRYSIDRTGILRYLRSTLFYFYKWMGVAIMMKSQSVKRVWVLNDLKSFENLNSDFRTSYFCYLPDPIKKIEEVKEYNLLETYGVKKNNKVLILFGSISTFKNIENILSALSKLNTFCITLLIIGLWASQEYKAYINTLIEDYLSKYPNLQIILKDRYFEEEEVNFLISKSYCVLIPYINFYFSSGVLGRSSSLRKPVVGSKGSLCEDLIELYSLGVTVNPHNPEEIADGIKRILSGEISSSAEGMARYVTERECMNFTDLLLEK